jgi:hypothetical protein
MVYLAWLRPVGKCIVKIPEPVERDVFDNGFVEAHGCVKDLSLYGAEMSPNRFASS